MAYPDRILAIPGKIAQLHFRFALKREPLLPNVPFWSCSVVQKGVLKFRSILSAREAVLLQDPFQVAPGCDKSSRCFRFLVEV